MIEKSHALLCVEGGSSPYITAIERRYKQDPGGIRRLASDYQERFITRKPQPSIPKELELRHQIAPPQVIESFFNPPVQATPTKKS